MRKSTQDVIGVGPRLVLGIIEGLGHEGEVIQCEDAVKVPGTLKGFEVLFVSGMSPDIESAIRVIDHWRGGPSVAGGPMYVDYEVLLSRGFDYVVMGEAETSLPLFLKVLERQINESEALGLAWIDRSGLHLNRKFGWASPDELWRFTPSIKAVKSYPHWRAARVYVEVVRGCSNFFRPTLALKDGRKCIFCDICRSGSLEERVKCPIDIPPGCGYCSVPNLFGPARSRPREQIVSEVKELVRLGVRRIVLSAPDFLDYGRDYLVYPKPLTDPREPPPNLLEIEKLLSELGSIPEVQSGDVAVMIENIKPNLVNHQVAETLGRYLAGTPVHIGLETGDPAHHVALGRPSTVPEVIQAVKLLRMHGLIPYIYVIHGLPGETNETIERTMKAIRDAWKAGAEKITLYRFTPLKGTAFEGFTPPPPAVRSRARPLYFLVKELNTNSKRRLEGSVIRCVVAGKDRMDRTICYSFPHGPVIKILNSEVAKEGEILKVRIERTISERVVNGKVVSS